MKEKRTGKKDRKLLWGTIIISMILSLMVFYVLYNANNKYMTREEKAIHGILYADGSYDSLPVYYLSREWEYYPDVLLTPGDDLEKYYFRYLSIGEYGGMELDDRNGNPYGSGTYRLRIMLPSEEHTYGLYLPEIFSAYNLYVDGKLIEQVGNPDPDHYEERIQHRMFTFKGHTSVEIMIAVTDKDSASPGIQYVPAFGNPLKVNTVRGIPVFLNSYKISPRNLLPEVHHHIRNLNLLIDQSTLKHPVDVLLPALLRLCQERNILRLHKRQQSLTRFLLNALCQREILLILVVHEDREAAVRILLKVLKALCRCT